MRPPLEAGGTGADDAAIGDLAADARAADAPPDTYRARLFRRFRRSRTGVAGLVLVSLILLESFLAPALSPYDPTERDRASQNSPPHRVRFDGGVFVHPLKIDRRCALAPFGRGWTYTLLGVAMDRHLLAAPADCPAHLLGTDGQGRDMLSRILVGSRLTLAMAALVVAISATIGTAVGLFSGFRGGWVDDWMQRFTELVLALPELPLYLALVVVIPRNADPLLVFFTLAAILSLLRWAGLARELRGKTLALRHADYVRAAEAVGAGTGRILFRHVLPNVLSHVVVVITLMVPGIVLLESFLSFLGIGVQTPMVSWGLLLNAAKDLQTLGSHPWMLLPVGAILATVLGFNMLGDGLRDAIDPHE